MFFKAENPEKLSLIRAFSIVDTEFALDYIVLQIVSTNNLAVLALLLIKEIERGLLPSLNVINLAPVLIISFK